MGKQFAMYIHIYVLVTFCSQKLTNQKGLLKNQMKVNINK